MKDIIIIGAGDFGREIANVIVRINSVEQEWNILGFVDDAESMQGCVIDGYPVLGTIDWLNNYSKEVYSICSLGVSKSRKKVIERVINPNVKWASLVDPDARMYADAEIGEGSIVCGFCILAINVKVGKHVVINLTSTLGHDAVLNNYCVVNPGVNISGKVVAGDCVDFGTGTKVLQGHHICANTTIGAGSVVVKDINEPGTYVGVPAKCIRGGGYRLTHELHHVALAA